MKPRLVCLAIVAAAASAASPLLGQETPASRLKIVPRVGALVPEEATALQPAASLGFDAVYRLTGGLSFGATFDFAPGRTDARYFVAVIEYGRDTTRIYRVGQEVGTLHYGLSVLLEPGRGRVAPYLIGGAGGYALYLETQINDGPRRVDGLMFHGGGGLRFELGASTGIELDVRDFVYTDYDREQLNPIRVAHRNRQPDGSVRFPGEEADVPAPKTTVHNVRLSVGFSYRPGGNP